MRVEYTVPMEGPGVSRRTGQQDDVSEAEGERLVARGLAHRIADDGQVLRVAPPRGDWPAEIVAAARADREQALAPPAPEKTVRAPRRNALARPAPEKAVK